MRKTTFFKTLLVAACLCLGSMSVWAKDVLNPTEATIIHGNGKNSGTEALSTVVHYDEDATTWNFNYVSINGTVFSNRLSNYGGSYVAIVKFDASSVLSGKALTSATLKFHSKCTEASKNSNVDVALIGTGWTASTATWDNTNTGSILSPVAVSTGTNVGTSGYNFSIDVYSQLNADIDKVIAFAFYTETGREQQLSDVTLEVESSVETLYKASFTANSGAITPTVTIYSDEEKTSSVSNGALLDGTEYYYRAVLEGYNNYEGSFTVDGANPSVSFTMTVKNVYSYTVKGKDGSSNDLGTIASGSTYEGDEVTVAYPRWILKGTTLYSSGSGAIAYKTTFTPDKNDYVKDITYNSGTVSNVAFYIEGEDVVGVTAATNADRASKGKMGYTGSSTIYKDVTTLSPGKYVLYMRGQNGNSTSRAYSFKVGDDDPVFTGSIANGTNQDENSVEFTVDATSTLSFACEGSSASGIDYFYAVRTGVSKTISSAGWATYCSPYALDFSGDITNLTNVYIVTGATGAKLNLTSVKGGTVPANTGLLIEGTEGVVSIPVVANSSTDVSANKLVGVTAEYALAAGGGYVLMASPNVGFYKNTNAFTVGANTAYLPVGFGTGYARSFFSFDDEETTGIESIANSQQLTANGEFFDLQGRRVAQPTKGLYIVNGRKIVIK